MDVRRSRQATRMIFLTCGLAVSSWAPMVPYAKDTLGLNDASLGWLLLFLGAGAISAMPFGGWLLHRTGSRRVILGAALLIAVTFPVLLCMHTYVAMAVVLFLFGAGVGTIDVAMNAHGVQVQNLSGRHIMSSLHGLFSVGGLCGPVIIGLLMKSGLTPAISAGCIAVLLLVIVGTQCRHLMDFTTEKAVTAQYATAGTAAGSRNVISGMALFLGVLCFISFLSEGAMLDWSAVFLRDNKGVRESMAGIGYAAFSIAMAAMRLLGDAIVARVPARRVVLVGAALGFAGFTLAVLAGSLALVLTGFILIGLGAANIVPVFFSAAGRQPNSTYVVSIISTMGYAGQLAGPALLGFIAHHFTLPVALFVTGCMLLLAGVAYSLAGNEPGKN